MTVERMYSHVTVAASGCHEWNGYRTYQGYGKTSLGSKAIRAHRLSWILQVGPIPDGLLVLHKCNNPSCVNIEHLYVGTKRDNAFDCVKAGTHFSMGRGQTHCKRGHEFTPENTRMEGSKRRCMACAKKLRRERWLRGGT